MSIINENLRIQKYHLLECVGEQDIVLPFGARTLSVLEEGNRIVLYARVDITESRVEPHKIRIYEVDQPAMYCAGDEYVFEQFIGTVKIKGVFNDMRIWHIFEATDLPF